MNEAALRHLWSVAIAALAAFIVYSSLSPQPLVPIETLSDKVGHALAYFSLALLVSGIMSPARMPVAMLCCLLLGAGLEIVQGAFTETRHAEWGDLAANMTGIAAAWLVAGRGRAGWGYRAFARRARRNRS